MKKQVEKKNSHLDRLKAGVLWKHKIYCHLRNTCDESPVKGGLMTQIKYIIIRKDKSNKDIFKFSKIIFL